MGGIVAIKDTTGLRMQMQLRMAEALEIQMQMQLRMAEALEIRMQMQLRIVATEDTTGLRMQMQLRMEEAMEIRMQMQLQMVDIKDTTGNMAMHHHQATAIEDKTGNIIQKEAIQMQMQLRMKAIC